MITIELERKGDAAAIERILDDAFGPERHRKTAQRLRDGACGPCRHRRVR